MAYRPGSHLLAALVAAATLAWATGCDGDEDDACFNCCECANDNSPLVFRPGASDSCTSCEDQCQMLADREFLGQEFDIVKEIDCDDE